MAVEWMGCSERGDKKDEQDEKRDELLMKSDCAMLPDYPSTTELHGKPIVKRCEMCHNKLIFLKTPPDRLHRLKVLWGGKE